MSNKSDPTETTVNYFVSEVVPFLPDKPNLPVPVCCLLVSRFRFIYLKVVK